VDRDWRGSRLPVLELLGREPGAQPCSTRSCDARTDAWFSVYGDARRALILQVYGNFAREDETGGHSLGIGSSIELRPSSRAELSLSPYLARSMNPWQYLGEQRFHDDPQYLLGRLDQTTASVTGRFNLTFTPNLSFQLYVAPFVSAGTYSAFKVVRAPRARTLAERFHTFAPDAVVYDADSHSYILDLNEDGEGDARLWNPNFNSKALNSNAVLRWEYRRGSTLFVVWSQGRWDYLQDGSFAPGRDFGQLLGLRRGNGDLPVTNVLLVKLNYWVGM
jgi:hypothetical protein